MDSEVANLIWWLRGCEGHDHPFRTPDEIRNAGEPGVEVIESNGRVVVIAHPEGVVVSAPLDDNREIIQEDWGPGALEEKIELSGPLDGGFIQTMGWMVYVAEAYDGRLNVYVRRTRQPAELIWDPDLGISSAPGEDELRLRFTSESIERRLEEHGNG